MKTHIANTMAIQERHPKALQHRQQLRLSQLPGEVAWGGAGACSETFFGALSAGKGLSLIIIPPG
jgi:hypothetical protein